MVEPYQLESALVESYSYLKESLMSNPEELSIDDFEGKN